MEPADIQALLENHIDECKADVQVDGSHVNVVVISAQFEGLNTLKKQQLVYGALNAAIADGRIHAVHMKTYTPAEWQAQQSS
ncbi:BolA family iron metabolism protein IbaG [Aurantivibrio infirmus]